MCGELPNSHAHIFWATIDYHRFWQYYDQIERRLVEEGGNGLTAAAVQRISRHYSITRGIAAPDGATQLAAILNAANWRDDLLQNAGTCCQLAEQASKSGSTNRRQISAITKLMWFLHPVRWTVFDGTAAAGLGLHPYGDTLDRCVTFYQQLHVRGFVEHADHGNEISSALASFNGFQFERVLDRYLMIRGSFYNMAHDQVATMLTAYLAGLCEQSCAALVGLAYQLESAIGPDPLNIYGAE